MIGPWWGILAVCSVLAGLFGALKLLERLVHPHPELVRKLLHVGMGLVVISFPWVFAEAWPVLLLAGVSAIALSAIKLVPALRDGVGSVLTGVHRASLGEVCFPAAVAALILLSRGDKLLFVVPMLIMTFADTVAALVGVAYGKVKYVTTDGFKSAEGSIAFFSIAFLSVHVPLLLCTDVPRPQTLLIAVIIGLLSTLIEATASRGLDNLLIPLGALGFLRLYLHASVDALVLRLVISVFLLALVLAWRRRSALDDSGLMAAALFGYGAYMLGGPSWLIGPGVLFLLDLFFWPRIGPRADHSVYAVVAITLAGVLWLGMNAASGGHERFLFPYAVGFGTQLAIIGVSRIAHRRSRRTPLRQLALSILAGSGLAGLQMLPLLIRIGKRLTASEHLLMSVGTCCCTALGTIVFYLMMPVLYGKEGLSPVAAANVEAGTGSRADNDAVAAIHLTSFAAGFIASMLAVGFQEMFEARQPAVDLFSIVFCA